MGKKVILSLTILISIFVFCNITSAYTISDIAINPSGEILPGTGATLTFTVTYNFNQNDKPFSGDTLNLLSDLDSPTYLLIPTYEREIYGGGTQTITAPAYSAAPEGYYPRSTKIDLATVKSIAGPVGTVGSSYLKNIRISTSGNIPFSCPSTGNFSVKVDHNDVRGNILKESIIPITNCKKVTPPPTTLPIEQNPYITGPTTISAPGTYILQNDFFHEGPNAGIHITASNVIFDGNSHTITGSGQIEQSMGVWIDGSNGGTAKNVIVKNVQIKNSYFGIYATSPEETNNNIINNIVTECKMGIFIHGGNKNTLTHNTASNNSYSGFTIGQDSHGNTLANNIARDNGYKNYYLYSTDNILSGNIDSRSNVSFTPTPVESVPVVTTVNPTLTGTSITTITIPTTQLTNTITTVPTTSYPTKSSITTAPTSSVEKLLEEQNKKIDEQNKLIAEQNKKIAEQSDLLSQLLNYFKGIFGWK